MGWGLWDRILVDPPPSIHDHYYYYISTHSPPIYL